MLSTAVLAVFLITGFAAALFGFAMVCVEFELARAIALGLGDIGSSADPRVAAYTHADVIKGGALLILSGVIWIALGIRIALC